ncbi:alcohol dehydrogenase [mine drainage metagenome]|uniref:Alcohol dehydrogenase n=1 Tax=mine drainage metagenome TaxID=410659 RepID=A0A1J5P1Q5_9ZZZZ
MAIVVGIGGVGGYSAQIAKAFGATVIAIDVDPVKLGAIREHGASLTLNPREHDLKSLKAKIVEFCNSNNLPVSEWTIFECSGTAAGQSTAFGLLTFGATLCVVGFTMDRVELRLSNLMAFDARALGNWGCPPELYPAALDLVLDGKIDLAAFVEQHPLDAINEIFGQAHAHRLARRAILVPQS